MAVKKARVPSGLDKAGRALWRSIISQLAADGLVPDARELYYLRQSCAEADLVVVLVAGLVGQPLVVAGSNGQDVAHPLIAEIRQHRMAGAALLARIALEDSAAVASRRESKGLSKRARSAIHAQQHGTPVGL